jgi:hypothetical protein
MNIHFIEKVDFSFKGENSQEMKAQKVLSYWTTGNDKKR